MPPNFNQRTLDAMWMLTRDFVSTDAPEGKLVLVCSRNFSEEKAARLIHRFHLVNDDGVVHGEGAADSCDDEKAFGPLDDFGTSAWGCSAIEYWSEAEQLWEML